MCGGTTIDRELHDLLGRKYGKHFAAKSIREISQGSEFMREFEDIKSRFDGSSGNQTLSLWMDRESGNGYDADLGVITITKYVHLPNK